jgi:hypothetical protein
MAADRPDRNLRFILGHAFTLDKLRLRLAEIEIEGNEHDEDGDDGVEAENGNSGAKGQHVSFRNSGGRPVTAYERKRSPPPDHLAELDDTDSDSDADEDEGGEEEDEEIDDGLSLRRFESASGKQPRLIDEEDGLDHSPYMPSEAELKMITDGTSSDELADLYQHVAGCPCHGRDAPTISKVWELPQKAGFHGPRVAVVEVAA